MKNTYIAILLSCLMLGFTACDKSDSTEPGFIGRDSDGGTGKGGSYARFVVIGNYLYSIHNNALLVYSISNPSTPELKNSIPMGDFFRTIETLFPFNGHLLFGTTNGMLVYSLSNPEAPQYISEVQHFLACDPVVAQGDHAYVTLNGSAGCRGTINQLDVVDISNFFEPKLLRSIQMTSPRGLGVDGNSLFVCDGNQLKVFSVENPAFPSEISQVSLAMPYDVIPFQNNLIVSAQEGIFQYDYTDPLQLKLRSQLVKVSK